MPSLEAVLGDITKLDADIIVNAANSRLVPGGGVDGAINKAAGPELGKAMMAIGRCPPGQAVITPAFNLRAKHVIHTVAPVFRMHPEKEAWSLLQQCYENALRIAADLNAHSIAFPSLGTGVYGIPIEPASEIAVRTVLQHAGTAHHPGRVIFCCFSAPDHAIYQKTIQRHASTD